MARRGRGEGTVYRRADGRWEAAFGFGGRRQRYVARSQRDVRIKLLAARRALEQGIVLSGSSQRVEEYLTRWLEDSVRPSVRWTTHRAYSLCMRRLFPLIGHLRLAALTPQAVQAAYAALLTKRPLPPQRGTDPHRPAPGPPSRGAMGSVASESDRGGDRPTSDSAGDAHAHRGRGRTALSGQPGSSLACAMGPVGHHR